MQNIKRLRLNVWLIKGEDKTTKQELKIIYMGRDLSKHYIEDLVFSNIIEEKCIGKKWLWTTLKMARSNCTDSSFLIAETSNFLANIFKREKEYFIPCWTRGEININGPARISKSLKNDIRKINMYKLDYELTNEQIQFNHFYNNMYTPFAAKRYGNKALVENYYELKAALKKGELLLVTMGGIPIAGMLIKYINKERAFLYALGVKDGNSDYTSFGATAALYYFSIKYLKQRGFNSVDIGSTRSFLNDGVLKYKKKWGFNIISASGIGFLMKPLSKKAAVKGFLLNNPFIFKDSNHIYGAVFVSSGQIEDQKSVKQIFHEYYFDGMSKLLIYVFDGTDSIMQMSMPNELNNKITILRA